MSTHSAAEVKLTLWATIAPFFRTNMPLYTLTSSSCFACDILPEAALMEGEREDSDKDLSVWDSSLGKPRASRDESPSWGESRLRFLLPPFGNPLVAVVPLEVA